MKISKLLELNSQNSGSPSLDNNLGDGFLYRNNRIFKNVRNAVLEAGYAFANQPSTEFLALPFSQLEIILAKKEIPYVNNVSVLAKMPSETQGQISWDDITDGYKRNYVFHESCHGIIRNQMQNLLKSKTELSTIEGQQKKCLQMLLEESFANSCELLGAIDAQDQAHKIFYELSSYSFLFEGRTFLKSAIDSLGEQSVFKFFVLTYLHSNFLVQHLGDRQFDIISKMSGIKKIEIKDLKNLKALAKIPFTLDLRFRTTTTALHLRLSGLNKGIKEIIDFDFMDVIKNESEYLQAVDGAAKKALHKTI